MLHKSAKFSLTWQLLFRSFHWGLNLVLKDFQVWPRMFQIPGQIWLFGITGGLNKDTKDTQKFADNYGYNVLRLNVLPKFSSNKSKIKREY